VGTETTGRFPVRAVVEDLEDHFQARKGVLTEDQIRRIEVDDAIVDTTVTALSLPRRLIPPLGLLRLRPRPTRTSAGTVMIQAHGAVRLAIEGRDCITEVWELPDDFPVVIGLVPLELLDFVVDPRGQRLIGNPEHGGEHMMDLF
jgi:predicted aspartyl protease